MADDKKYNGWTNYETWATKLWIDNEESSSNYWSEVAQECYDEAGEGVSAYAKFTGKEIFTREERAVLELDKRLKAEIEEGSPLEDAGLYTDLLNAALSEVNWHEIAESMMENVSKEEVSSNE